METARVQNRRLALLALTTGTVYHSLQFCVLLTPVNTYEMRGLSAFILLGGLSTTFATESVFLYPLPNTFASSHAQELSPKEAQVVLAHHLGLESFEPFGYSLKDNEDAYGVGLPEDFVGKGLGSAVVLAMTEEDARGKYYTLARHTLEVIIYASEIMPHSHQSTFLTDLPFSASSLLSTYSHEASDVYEIVASSSSPLPIHHGSSQFLDIFNLPTTPASLAFQQEATSLTDFLEYGDATTERFGAFQITSLSKMADQYGRDSEEYRMAKTTFLLIVESLQDTMTKSAIIVSTKPTTPTIAKRQQPPQSPFPPPLPSPNEPISAISTCYPSEEWCESETDDCSGHGSCVSASKAGRTCFVCACSSTQSTDGRGRTKTTKWAGNACDRKDVSSEFVLLAGTAIGLILFVLGSVALLVAAGEQKLPSVLTGGVVASKKDN